MKQEHGKRANKVLEQAVRSPELAEKCIWNCAGAPGHTRGAAGPEPWEGTAARWAGQGRRVWGEQGNEGNKVSDEPWRQSDSAGEADGQAHSQLGRIHTHLPGSKDIADPPAHQDHTRLYAQASQQSRSLALRYAQSNRLVREEPHAGSSP